MRSEDRHRSARQFQCSSASRKFLNKPKQITYGKSPYGFSALQRAENSSMMVGLLNPGFQLRFSALQRAENSSISMLRHRSSRSNSFSALQRAENSSILREPGACHLLEWSFSALQRAENSSIRISPFPADTPQACVSVLFSEPKIPQSRPSHLRPSIFPTATITLRRS